MRLEGLRNSCEGIAWLILVIKIGLLSVVAILGTTSNTPHDLTVNLRVGAWVLKGECLFAGYASPFSCFLFTHISTTYMCDPR